VRTRGVEASWLWQATDGLSWRNALSINDSRYGDDYVSSGQVVRVDGKRVVNSPRTQFSSALHYSENGWFAQLSGKYTGERAASYSNDLMAPAHTLWRLAAGYERAAFLGLKKFRAQLNVENLSDRDYLATIGAAGYLVNDPTGASTYVQVGAPRAAFFSVSGEM
jgi:iron complex outermembrane receptor protein